MKTYGDQNHRVEDICIECLMDPEYAEAYPFFANYIRINRHDCEEIEHKKGIAKGIVFGELSVLGGFVIAGIIASMIKK